MNKIIIALCAFLAVACAEQYPAGGHIQFGRNKIQDTVFRFGEELDRVNNEFAEQFETIDLHDNLIVDSITRTQERFAPMEWIGGPVKQCAQNSRSRIPVVEETKQLIEKCKLTAGDELVNALKAVTDIKKNVEKYLGFFEKEIAKCGNDGARIYQVISQAIKFLDDNSNAFYSELEAAICALNVQVKKHMHCTYLVKTKVQTLIGEANALLNQCLVVKEKCKPCGKNTCENAIVVDGHSLGKTLANPLLSHPGKPGCVMVNFEYKNSSRNY